MLVDLGAVRGQDRFGVASRVELGLPEAGALEGDPPDRRAARQVCGELGLFPGEAVSQQGRRVRGGALEEGGFSGARHEAEAGCRVVESVLEDAFRLGHDACPAAAKVEGHSAGRGREGVLDEGEGVDVEGLVAPVFEADPGDLADIEGRLRGAAEGAVLLAAPESAGDVDVDDGVAGRRAEGRTVPVVERLVVVLELEADGCQSIRGVVEVDAEGVEAAEIGAKEAVGGGEEAGIDPQRSLAVRGPVLGAVDVARCVARPFREADAPLEILHEGRRRIRAPAPGQDQRGREQSEARRSVHG